MQGQGSWSFTAALAAVSLSLLFSSVGLLPNQALAALPAPLSDDIEMFTPELSRERWQRFLHASAARYQALAEKAGMHAADFADDCAEAHLSLHERSECLRSDVFARSAMERDGMTLDEYARVLHSAVTRDGSTHPTASQRGQFQRLRAEWWPQQRTASQ